MGGVVIDVNRFTCGVGLKLYAVWEDRSPRTVRFSAGEGQFADGTKEKTKQISYPYTFSPEEGCTYTGNESGTWVFAGWRTNGGFNADETYTVTDNEVFTAEYRRIDISVNFQNELFKYNETSGLADIEFGEVTISGSNQYGELTVYADNNGVIPYPVYSHGLSIPQGYEISFMLYDDALTESGVAKLKNAGSRIYFDGNELAFWSLPASLSLTSDMLVMEQNEAVYPIVMFAVPSSGPEERVRFDKYIYRDDTGYGIVDSNYDAYVTYTYGNGIYEADSICSVALDSNGNIVIPSFTVEQQPKEGQSTMVLINIEHLANDGVEALKASGARVFSLSGWGAYYEVKNSVTLTREMVKIELQPRFIIAYVPENSTGLNGAIASGILYVESTPGHLDTDVYFINYANNGSGAEVGGELTYDANGVLSVTEYTVFQWTENDVKENLVPEEGKELIFLVDLNALKDSAVNAQKAAGAREYTASGAQSAYCELKIGLSKDMVKFGVVPNIYMAYVSVD